MKHFLSQLMVSQHALFHGAARWFAIHLLGRLRTAPSLDLLLVVPESQRGWILEGIAREIAMRFPGTYQFYYSTSCLPPAKTYFFVHYSTLVSAYRRNPILWTRKVFAWYTHPRDDLNIDFNELRYLLRRIDRIFCSCSQFAELLVKDGVTRCNAVFVPGGADSALFCSHKRGGGKVGFVSAYYERKSPSTIIDIIKMMPSYTFVLLGRQWEQYERFGELKQLPNFEYIDTSYKNYPTLYATMDVFVSVSKLEGGPIPLVEAMMSNVVPVASRTGFAPDLIQHGSNGFLFQVDANAATICGLIEQAARLQVDVRATVMHCTWDQFASTIHRLMGYEGLLSEPSLVVGDPSGEGITK